MSFIVLYHFVIIMPVVITLVPKALLQRFYNVDSASLLIFVMPISFVPHVIDAQCMGNIF